MRSTTDHRSCADAPRRALANASPGFTLPEVIVGLALLAGFLLLCIGVVQAAQRLLPGRSVVAEGMDLPIAPSPGAFADAVKLHSVFLERLGAARAVYVFGGTHQGLPTEASRLNGRPLSLSALPTIATFSAGLPLDGYAFHQAYATQLGAFDESRAADDFTVLIVGPSNGQLAVTALVQVRSRSVAPERQGEPIEWVSRSTTLYDVSGDTWNCAFVEKASLASAQAVGARHFWHRYAEGRVAEEGPTMAVFPDPWLYAGNRGAENEAPPFSRFTYFLAVNP